VINCPYALPSPLTEQQRDRCPAFYPTIGLDTVLSPGFEAPQNSCIGEYLEPKHDGKTDKPARNSLGSHHEPFFKLALSLTTEYVLARCGG
jgi:hypothetical protein